MAAARYTKLGSRARTAAERNPDTTVRSDVGVVETLQPQSIVNDCTPFTPPPTTTLHTHVHEGGQ